MRIVVLGLLLAACNIPKMVDKQTMTTMAPQMMANPDVGLGCASGAALAPVVASLGKEGHRPDKSLVLTQMSAGMCLEPLVWDAELRRMIAAAEGRSGTVEDQLEIERRHHADAALRYLQSWRHLETAFGPVGEGCPALDTTRNDDLLYLLGLSSGLLALVHDRAAGGVVGAPMDLVRKVERGAACLDDTTWWGVPGALQAAVWSSVPGAGPEGVDPFTKLAEAAEKGQGRGVHLARAFQVQTLANAGRQGELRAAIGAWAQAAGQPGESPDFRLLNSYAGQLIRHESDKIWVREAGHRTPGAMLGQFPSTGAPAEVEGLDSLLDSLIPADAAPEEGAGSAQEKTP